MKVAREEHPATGFSPLKDQEDPDSIVGSFDLLSREEILAPKFYPPDVALRDTMETVEARWVILCLYCLRLRLNDWPGCTARPADGRSTLVAYFKQLNTRGILSEEN